MAETDQLLEKELRSETLDPDLVNAEFSTGWAFALPRAFRSALDIVSDVRAENKVKRQTWTQGKNFAFAVGDTL